MFFKNKKAAEKVDSLYIPASKEDVLLEMKRRISSSADFKIKELPHGVTLFYFDTLIESSMLHQDVIAVLERRAMTPKQMMDNISVGDTKELTLVEEAFHSLIKGAVLIHSNGYPVVIAANIKVTTTRSLSKPENESQVLGPQLAFNEDLNTNLSLVRRYVASPDLCNESFTVGTRSRTNVSLLYMKDLADEEMIQTLRQRISDIKIDGVLDSSILIQLIDDNSLSLFPQVVLTERPDRTASWLLDGKLVVMVDGSTQAVGGPLSFIEFFQSMEDQNVRWHISTFLRLLRVTAMFLSIFFTAVYVASLTYHYEIIPQTLLIPLTESRSKVPFPPMIEALFLEFTIELLREAGARLPTKVGQTMGIVGGIVVGTAAVEAGFTSNILIIIIALSALASFTTPSYMMGNVIRVIRFPLILLAGFWGFFGLGLGYSFLIIHLLRQSSLGSPFLAPFYPPRFKDWRDSIIRLPFAYTTERPAQSRPKDTVKSQPEKK